jgi:hypothetical protein
MFVFKSNVFQISSSSASYRPTINSLKNVRELHTHLEAEKNGGNVGISLNLTSIRQRPGPFAKYEAQTL